MPFTTNFACNVVPSAGRVHKSWGSTVSDDSVVGEGALESPTVSTSESRSVFLTLPEKQTLFVRVNISKQTCFLGDITKIPRTSSTGTMSSNEDVDEKDGNVNSFESEVKSKCLSRLNRRVAVSSAVLDEGLCVQTSTAWIPTWWSPPDPSGTSACPRRPRPTGSGSCARPPSAASVTATCTSRGRSVRR